MAEEVGRQAEDRTSGGQLAAAISNKVVQLLSEYTGRGPTRARTFINDGLVVCLLQDTLTKGERALAERGRHQEVLDLRRTFQQTMRQEAAAAIEELTGHRVVAFMSDNHIEPDIAVEIFMLQPQPTGTSKVPATEVPFIDETNPRAAVREVHSGEGNSARV